MNLTDTQLMMMNLLNSNVCYKNNFHRPGFVPDTEEIIKQMLMNQHYIMLSLLELRGCDTKKLVDKIEEIHYDHERSEYVLS
jgi:hypothetical protein